MDEEEGGQCVLSCDGKMEQMVIDIDGAETEMDTVFGELFLGSVLGEVDGGTTSCHGGQEAEEEEGGVQLPGDHSRISAIFVQ